jgi:F-type H+-transporting ATPase subunit c
MKRLLLFALGVAVVSIFAPAALAQGAGGTAESTASMAVLAAGFSMAFASAGGAIGQGIATAHACEGLARNPGAEGAIRFALILGLVLMESMALYTFAIIFLFIK